MVARVGANGNPDTSFSGDGIAIADFTAGDDFAWDLALQADGKLVAAGVAGGTPAAMAVLRLTTNGSNDPTFDGDGRASAGLSGEDAATSVAIQPDGAVVVGGFNSLNGGQMLIGRMLPSGAMDPAFSGDGLVPVNFGGTADYAWRVAVQADGAIVAVGRAGGAGGRFAVARVTSAGILDGSFSGDGKVGTNFTAGNDEAHSVAIDGAGNLVVSGVANGGTSAARIAIARYLAT